MASMEKERWAVTYTKHLKQKRKVYQDGFLQFNNSTFKIELFDDCQKLLCVRIAKEDEVIRSGETLAFNAYLVDIGDLEGGCKPMSSLNGQVREKKVMEKAGLLRPKKKFSPVFGSGKSENKASSSCLSPSQKIIKEFKKHEMLKYGGSANCSPNAVETTNSDWQVLYTTQKTQKAKMYHDGFLRIATCGSQGRQATLYDLSRRVLDSRFLKKDEVIESGKSLVFDGHLVDVGDPEIDHKPPSYIKPQGKSFTAVNENFAPGSTNVQLNGLTADKYARREWHALYTNQITQKAKKYQSGFLTLTSCGSFQRQVTLIAEDGTTLCRQFLKLSEDIKSNSSFRLPNYLVEVGEPRGSPEGEPPILPSAEREENSTSCLAVDSSVSGKTGLVDKPLHDGKPPRNALSGRKVKSILHPGASFGPGNGDPVDKPLCCGEPPKDASSRRVLKSTFHPTADSSEPENCDSKSKPFRGGEPLKDASSGRVPKSNFHPTADSSEPENCDSKNKPLRGANDILSILRKEKTTQSSFPTKSIFMEQLHHSRSPDKVNPQYENNVKRDVGDCSFERHGEDNCIAGVLDSEDSEFGQGSQSKYSALSNSSIREEDYDFSVLNSHGEHTSLITPKPFSSAKELQVKHDSQRPLPFDYGHTEAFIKSMFPKDASASISCKLPKELNTRTFTQPDEVAEMDTGMTSFEVCNKVSQMDEIPSFDLGF